MDDEARVEIAKLRTRLFILEKKVEMLINSSNQKETPMTEPKKTPAPVGHNEVHYPRTLPTHSIGHIIAHIRKTEVLPLPDFGQHITTVIGCGLEFAKTTPQPVGAKSTENFSAMSDDEVADKLETLTAPQAHGAAAPPEAFPTWLLPILFDVFRRYFGF